MKPPVGTPGVDVFCVSIVCKKCNRHFLIKEEVQEHQRVCRGWIYSALVGAYKLWLWSSLGYWGGKISTLWDSGMDVGQEKILR